MDFKLTTPVAFIVFNRPEVSLRVFERIRQVKPEKLFLIADGPRTNKIGEAEKCAQCRVIKDMVDWQCELHLNFSKENMGCKDRMYSGISWVFENVDEAIILEDDCLPSISFFRFCQELLEKYRNDTRVTVIGGSNHDYLEDFSGSYGFSFRTYMWGWATWKRAWKLMDIDMTLWSECKKHEYLKRFLQPWSYYVSIANEFQATYDGIINSWAYRFCLSIMLNNGLNIVPKVNMVRNIGFGADATHTREEFSKDVFYLDEEMDFPLIHPKIMLPRDRVKENLNPRLSVEELNAEFNQRDAQFKKFLQEENYVAVVDYFKDTLRNSSVFHFTQVYYLAYAYLMLDDYYQSRALVNDLLKLNVIAPASYMLFIRAFLTKRHFDDGLEILDSILQKTPTFDESLNVEIVNLINSCGEIVFNAKYQNIYSYIKKLAE